MTIKGLTVTKPRSHQVKYAVEAGAAGATPAQFLPSTMLSWRAPIMPRRNAPIPETKPAGSEAPRTAPGQRWPLS